MQITSTSAKKIISILYCSTSLRQVYNNTSKTLISSSFAVLIDDPALYLMNGWALRAILLLFTAKMFLFVNEVDFPSLCYQITFRILLRGPIQTLTCLVNFHTGFEWYWGALKVWEATESAISRVNLIYETVESLIYILWWPFYLRSEQTRKIILLITQISKRQRL